MYGSNESTRVALGLSICLTACSLLGIGCQSGQQESTVYARASSKAATTARTEAPTAALHTVAVTWPQHDPSLPDPHTVFGEPIFDDHDSLHNITHRYGAFTVYYDDEVLAPRWTAIKLTAEMADANSDFRRPSGFKTDPELRDAGFEVTKHSDYNNLPGSQKWNRGHMVQFDDARGYGDQAGRDSMFTSNVCPQLGKHNQRGWLTLEQTCTEFARDFEVVWVYTGPIYDDDPQPFEAGRIVPAPVAFYKVVVSPAENGGVDVLAFRMLHEPIPRDADLSEFLVSIDDIEAETGIDFLHELPDPIEDELEEAVWELWPDTP